MKLSVVFGGLFALIMTAILVIPFYYKSGRNAGPIGLFWGDTAAEIARIEGQVPHDYRDLVFYDVKPEQTYHAWIDREKLIFTGSRLSHIEAYYYGDTLPAFCDKLTQEFSYLTTIGIDPAYLEKLMDGKTCMEWLPTRKHRIIGFYNLDENVTARIYIRTPHITDQRHRASFYAGETTYVDKRIEADRFSPRYIIKSSQ